MQGGKPVRVRGTEFYLYTYFETSLSPERLADILVDHFNQIVHDGNNEVQKYKTGLIKYLNDQLKANRDPVVEAIKEHFAAKLDTLSEIALCDNLFNGWTIHVQ